RPIQRRPDEIGCRAGGGGGFSWPGGSMPPRAIAARSTSPALPALLLLGTLSVAGCGDETMQAASTDPCESLRAECLTNQQACVAGKDGARCEACGEGTYAASCGSCAALGGKPLSHDFSDFTVKSGEEIKGLCQSWTLGNA